MINFQSGVLDRARLISNLLMVILVAGNIFFSIQYTQNLIRERDAAASTSDKESARILASKFLRSFIDIVLNNQSTISLEERVKLEDQALETKDADIIKLWNAFVNSADGKTAQTIAIKLMSVTVNKML